MSERMRSPSSAGYPYSTYNSSVKMATDLTPKKTLLILVIVVGCFAVLWPKVFYPMLVGSAQQQMKPSAIDKRTGCCDVISETDVNTIKILSELCKSIIEKQSDGKKITGKEIVPICKSEVLKTCGIDISAVLQEQIKLGRNVKQILDDVRSLNGSLCLKYNYGVSPSRLGVPHRIIVKPVASDTIRQERPPHIKSEMLHPAFRERGRAIPQPQSQASPSRPPPRIVEGRPGPLPGMRPTIGGAGHVVPPPKQGTSSMSVIMPIYTIGIVIFFSYTLMKILFKKQPDGVGGSLYPPVHPDPNFRREVFESDKSQLASRIARDGMTSKLGDLELDQLRRRLQETEQAMERIVAQMAKVPLKTQDDHLANGKISNGTAVKPHDEDQPSVTVMGMEMRASCEGGEKWTRSDSPVWPQHHAPVEPEPVTPPQEIFLEGALPAQSQLLVSDSATEAEQHSGEDPAVVLAGKMTLSVVNVENENDEASEEANTGDEEKEILLQPSDELSNVFNIKTRTLEIPIAESVGVGELNESGDITLEPNEQIPNVFDIQHREMEMPVAEPLTGIPVAPPLIEKYQSQELKTEPLESSVGSHNVASEDWDVQERLLIEGEPKLELEKQIDSLINEAQDIVLETAVSPSVDEFELLRKSKERDVEKLLHDINDPVGVIRDIKSDEQLLEDIADSVEVRNGNAHKQLSESLEKLSQRENEIKEELIGDVIGSYNETIDERSEANTLQEVSNIEDEAAPVDDNRVIMEQVFQDKVDRLQTAPVSEEQKTDDEIIDSEDEVEYEEEDEEDEEIEEDDEIAEGEHRDRAPAMPGTNQDGKVNGTDAADESKYTNVSSAAVAELNISERDRTDEEVDEDVEDEEIEEVIYVDEDEEEEEEEEDEQNEVHINDERDNMNHISHRSSDDD